MILIKDEVLILEEDDEISDILYKNVRLIIKGDKVIKNEFKGG